MKHTAFSLVELSIVLVILGLLVGGILAGKSLVRASEMRAITTEYQRYFTSIQAFKDKYFEIPGDISTGTAIWGKDNANCPGDTGTAATPGTCNGNSDRILTVAAGATSTSERTQFWKQLALAGLVEGNYSGIVGALGANDQTGGTNVPASKATQAMWTAANTSVAAGNSLYFAGDYGNFLRISARDPATGNGITAFLLPEEAWNIDTKLDDGKPYGGKLYSNGWNNACAIASSNQDTTATYNLSTTTAQCFLYFIRQF